eukprot:jgi/Chrzof1/8137/UNPLg00184.t1
MSSLEAIRQLGNSLFKEGRYKEAEEAYTRAISLDSVGEEQQDNSPHAEISKLLSNRSACYLKLGMLHGATSCTMCINTAHVSPFVLVVDAYLLYNTNMTCTWASFCYARLPGLDCLNKFASAGSVIIAPASC